LFFTIEYGIICVYNAAYGGLIMIGERLKEIKKIRGITQADIAEITGVSVSAVKKWEQDQTDPNTGILIKLADHLNVSIDYLLKRSDTVSIDPDAEDSLLYKYRQLDDTDKDKVESYADGLLENDKYKKDTPTIAVS